MEISTSGFSWKCQWISKRYEVVEMEKVGEYDEK
jgi:hypothetical protein